MYESKLRNVKYRIKATNEIIEGSEWEIDTGRGSPFIIFSEKESYNTDKHYLSFEIEELGDNSEENN